MAIIKTLKDVVVSKQKTERLRNKYLKQHQGVLKALLSKAKNTSFGKEYQFKQILKSKEPEVVFQQIIPVFDYESMLAGWWHRLFEGEKNVCWPGKIKYFALTSGTSSAASKKIPVTNDMIQAIRRTGIRQLLVLKNLKLGASFYQTGALMIGGSTDLINVKDYMEGDLSGILQSKLPFWFSIFYKPGKPIAKQRDWGTKLEQITRNASKWDIGAVAGVPAWVQLLFEKIIKHYNVRNIHDIWPNLKIYCHGGVAFQPYKKRFESLLGKDIYYLETYLASEGFLAYQKGEGRNMQLVLDNGIYFEFIPFTEENFTEDGTLRENPTVLTLADVKEGIDYALLISTVSGAWRYLIGDTIRFTSITDFEIIITGRTKHFLSLCGEHLSVDNMTKAIQQVSEQMGLEIREFTVAGIPYDGFFAHQWYIGTDIPYIKEDILAEKLDLALKELNDDYKVERSAALKAVNVTIVPIGKFYDFMRIKGKEGGQNKFPRVIKGQLLEEWNQFLQHS